VLRIEDTRRDEPAFIDSLLESTLPTERAEAALAVGRIGARAHLPTLRRLVTDPDAETAATALFALGLLKDTVAAPLAASALRAGDREGIEAAWLLGELGEAGRQTIVAALADPAVSPLARNALVLAAARLRPVPAAALVPLLASPDSALAWRAAYAIARGRSAAGARSLLALSASQWASVREQVARVASHAIAGDSLAPVALPALRTLMRDTSAHVRVNAVRALATYGNDARVDVVAALHDTDPNVVLAAAQSLGEVLDSAAASWNALPESGLPFVALGTIVDLAGRRGIRLDSLTPWATSRDWRRRAAVAEVDIRGAPPTALAAFALWRRDADGRVRAAATSAIASYADSASSRDSVRRLLRGLLTDRDVGVRASSLGALRRAATLEDLDAALRTQSLANADRDSDARLAFWQLADSALAHAASDIPDSTRRRLSSLTRPADPLERRAAAKIGLFAAWRDSGGTARPIAWYEARAREAASRTPTLRIETDRGAMELRLFVADAPLTVYDITSLARRGYFNGQLFHRVVPNFVVQGGDPRGDGNGGPGYAIRDELNRHRYLRGVLGMALSGPNTGGSQFFITHSPQPHLDGGYTVFGELIRGGDVLDRIVQGDRIVRITVR
jgi:cyclophilin family peptidyl-prolyl cis-trans isomerase